jgi:DNA-binding MarR family transcriptional regulator
MENLPRKVIPDVHHHVPQHLARRFAQICAALLSEVPAPFSQPGWHFALLRQINEMPGEDRGWHATAIGSDASTTGKGLELLEAQGLVARTVRPTDRRANTYTITPAGTALLHQLSAPVRAVAKHILSPLTEAEADTLMALLTRLVDAHEDHARPGAGRRKPTPRKREPHTER